MADRHKRRPRAVRLGELEDRLVAYAAEHDRTVNSVIVEAVSAFLSGPAKPARRKPAASQAVVGYSKEQQARGKR